MYKLRDKKCIPCHGGILPLTKEEAEKFLKEVDNWNLIEERGTFKIQKLFKFKNFKEAKELVDKVAELAEKEGHHPTISFGWGFAKISFYTHSIKGLHENDFIMAAKVDEIGKHS